MIVSWLHGPDGAGGLFELGDAGEGPGLQERRIPGNRRFPGALHLRQPSIQGLNQFEQDSDVGLVGHSSSFAGLW